MAKKKYTAYFLGGFAILLAIILLILKSLILSNIFWGMAFGIFLIKLIDLLQE